MKLKKINLKKAVDRECPGVRIDGTQYLAKIGGQWLTGPFSRQWYGLNFDTVWGMSGRQFDAPGYNRSDWQELYEIVE